MIKKYLLSILILTVLSVSGCGRMNAYNACHNYQYRMAIDDFKKQTAKQEKYVAKKNKFGRNYCLPYVHLASAAMAGGSYTLADEALQQARPVMQRIAEDSSKNVAALLTTEDKRQYKGDPYEVTMANFYQGLIRYYNGEYDRALALFRRSLVSDMDANAKKDEYLDDFTIGHIMAAKSYMLLGEPDNAHVMLQKAEPYIEDQTMYAEFKEHFLTDNFTLIIENGVGPFKVSCGMGRAAIRLMEADVPVAGIQVYIDGELKNWALYTSDVYQQAKQHRPSGGRRAIQAVKGFVAEACKTVSGFQITGSKSDSRSWILLPHDIFIYSTTLEPGMHTVTLKCFNQKGEELPRYEQTWYYIPVQDGAKDNLLLLHTGLDKCNQYKKIKRQYVLTDQQQADVKGWK